MLAADAFDEEVYKNDEGEHGEYGEHGDEGEMEEEEVNGLMAAVDSGMMSLEQVNAIQRKIQRRGRCFNYG